MGSWCLGPAANGANVARMGSGLRFVLCRTGSGLRFVLYGLQFGVLDGE